MKKALEEIFVNKETVSDDTYKITGIYFKSGDYVTSGTIIGSFETSKADIDLECTKNGYIHYFGEIGQEISPGYLFAIVTEENSLPESYKKVNKGKSEEILTDTNEDSPRFSKAAKKLIEKYNIDLENFKGMEIVDKSDVERLIAKSNIEEITDKPLSSKDFYASNKIILVGGGKHTRACIDIIRANNLFTIAGVVFTESYPASGFLDVPVLGGLDSLSEIFHSTAKMAVIAIGSLDNSSKRQELFDRAKEIGYFLPNIIHPRAIVEASVRLGEGNQVFGGANLGSYVKIGDNCIINSNSIVSHDCELGNNVHITPGAVLAGSINVGNNTIIGMNSTIYYGVKIGRNVIINNGMNVFHDIKDNNVLK